MWNVSADICVERTKRKKKGKSWTESELIWETINYISEPFGWT